ncbi:MAG: hypothetical protein OJF47_003886 [Nitrospira sp.]|jgi:hypothetical protein|nr:MAG: hypothetical protein OJF47_003886 [Nitrospira sp.]
MSSTGLFARATRGLGSPSLDARRRDTADALTSLEVDVINRLGRGGRKKDLGSRRVEGPFDYYVVKVR